MAKKVLEMMKARLFALLAGLLMVGCGEEAEKEEDDGVPFQERTSLGHHVHGKKAVSELRQDIDPASSDTKRPPPPHQQLPASSPPVRRERPLSLSTKDRLAVLIINLGYTDLQYATNMASNEAVSGEEFEYEP